MRLHEALEKTETGQVRRRTWGKAVISRCDSGTTFLHLVDAMANDWETVPPEYDEWEAEALRVLDEERHYGVKGLVCDIAKALKVKFGKPPLDVEQLAMDVADRWCANRDASYMRDAIIEAAKAQREGK